jgi:hypothetical protein
MRAADENDAPAAEYAPAADRFAREIVGMFTVSCATRLGCG